MNECNKGLLKLENPPSILTAASAVGKKEYEGPLGNVFDYHDEKDRFGQDTWEKAESEMQRTALNLALAKVKLKPDDIDIIFAGDLINQCTSSSYGMLDFNIPLFGLYGACSTLAESMILSALTVSLKIYKRAVAITSSHNCSAERQFRLPVEYGGQRTPTSQWTVTGAGAFIICGNNKGPYITEVMAGRLVDKGINDANNMGAAMAPAVIDTLTRYFNQSKNKPDDYDMILTGDLGAEGHGIVSEFMKADGYNLGSNYSDCGLMIYDREKQDMHSGGSGCGCSAVVMASKILSDFRDGKLKDILFIGTGALMSPMSIQQGQTIPGIAHLVRISKECVKT